MKGGMAIVSSINYCEYVKPTQLLVQTTVAAGPTQLSTSQLYFRKATVMAAKSLAGEGGTANQSNVFVGFASAASQQPFILAPGNERTFEPPNGAKWSLADLYLVVSADNDGVVVLYC